MNVIEMVFASKVLTWLTCMEKLDGNWIETYAQDIGYHYIKVLYIKFFINPLISPL